VVKLSWNSTNWNCEIVLPFSVLVGCRTKLFFALLVVAEEWAGVMTSVGNDI
jgi:hypothetical protein